ncbi:MAG TPA: RNA methyltransferase, partial [Anaerolineaceae bacterium]|nr:RNA methyltransferase [Anaerolineaceae bacterium]
MELITSSANPKIKRIRKLRERKEREQAGVAYIEGLRIVGEALYAQVDFDSVITAPELLTSEYGRDLAQDLENRHVPMVP